MARYEKHIKIKNMYKNFFGKDCVHFVAQEGIIKKNILSNLIPCMSKSAPEKHNF